MDPQAAGADNKHGRPVLAGAASSSVQSVRNWIQLAVPLTVGRGEAAVQSLKKVLKAGTLVGSEEDAPNDLKHFKELLKSKLRERVAAAVDDLPSLLAGSVLTIFELVPIITECTAATEATLSQNNKVNQSGKLHLEDVPIFEEIEKIQQDPKETLIQAETGEYDILGTRKKRSCLEGISILAEIGLPQIVLNAVSDGSHFVCAQCGGVINNSRKKHHLEVWCRVPKMEKSNIEGTSIMAETEEYDPLGTTFPDNLQQILKDFQGTETGKSGECDPLQDAGNINPHGTSIVSGAKKTGDCDPLQETGKSNIEGSSIISERKKSDPQGTSMVIGSVEIWECDPLQETGKSSIVGTSIISERKKSDPHGTSIISERKKSDPHGTSIISGTKKSGECDPLQQTGMSNIGGTSIISEKKNIDPQGIPTISVTKKSRECDPLQETRKSNIEGTSIISETKKSDPQGMSIISGTKKSGQYDPLQETVKSNIERTSIVSGTKKSGDCDPLQETGKSNIGGTAIIYVTKKIDSLGTSIISGTKKSEECDPLQETGKSNIEGMSIIFETKKIDSQVTSIVSETVMGEEYEPLLDTGKSNTDGTPTVSQTEHNISQGTSIVSETEKSGEHDPLQETGKSNIEETSVVFETVESDSQGTSVVSETGESREYDPLQETGSEGTSFVYKTEENKYDILQSNFSRSDLLHLVKDFMAGNMVTEGNSLVRKPDVSEPERSQYQLVLESISRGINFNCPNCGALLSTLYIGYHLAVKPQIVLDAINHGTTFPCPKCVSQIGVRREDDHLVLRCSKKP